MDYQSATASIDYQLGHFQSASYIRSTTYILPTILYFQSIAQNLAADGLQPLQNDNAAKLT